MRNFIRNRYHKFISGSSRLNNAGERALLPVIFRLAWPLMLEEVVFTIMSYVDYAMVGSIGTEATAAVGCTSTVSWVVGSTTNALAVGFVAYISQAIGAGDNERARRATAQSIFVTIVVGLLFTAILMSIGDLVPVWMQADPAIQADAAAYFKIIYLPMLFRASGTIMATVLEGSGETKKPLLISAVGNLLNVVMNFFLIYRTRTVSLLGLEILMPGAGLGVRGAAIATAISIVVDGIWVMAAVLRDKQISPIGYPILPDMKVLRPCLKVALPNMLQRMITSFGYVLFASMINTIGTVATAAHTVANTVESLFYMPGYGMQLAAATLSGNAIGAKDRQRQRDQQGVIITLEIGMMLISGSLLFIFAPQMAGIFSEDPDVIALSTTVLRMVALSEPFYGTSIVIEGMLQGAGKTRHALFFNIFGMWGVRLLGTFICTQLLGLGLAAAWGCMIAHNLTLFTCFTIYFRSGKWNPLK